MIVSSPYNDTLYTQTDSADIHIPNQPETESEQPQKHLGTENSIPAILEPLMMKDTYS